MRPKCDANDHKIIFVLFQVRINNFIHGGTKNACASKRGTNIFVPRKPRHPKSEPQNPNTKKFGPRVNFGVI